MLGKAHCGIPLDFYRGPNPDDIDFYSEFDVDDIGDGSAGFHGILRGLAQKALDSGLKVTLGLTQSENPLLAVEFPASGITRHVFILSRNCAKFQGLDFSAYQFLEPYHAIWANRLDIVEARVDWAEPRAGILLRYVMSGGLLSPGYVVTDRSSGAELRLGRPSPAAQALLDITDSIADGDIPTMTIALAGSRIGSAEEAVAKLESIGNAFLFQIGLKEGILPSLVGIPSKEERLAGASRRDSDPYRWDLDLGFPQRRIEAEPLALYYYAGTLRDDFPLLKFLAYYQVLEYFFGKYSRRDVIRPEHSLPLLSDFDVRKVGDVAGVVVPAATKNRRGRGYEAERKQLRVTITECVDHRNLGRLLAEHYYEGVALREHLANPQRIKGVRLVRANRDDNDTSVLPVLADRIYDIRNRIVHAKQGRRPLFPFSEESKALQPDIEVLRYLAATVLIYSATSI